MTLSRALHLGLALWPIVAPAASFGAERHDGGSPVKRSRPAKEGKIVRSRDVDRIMQRIRDHDFSRNSGYTGVGNLDDRAWSVRTLAVRDLARMGAGSVPALIRHLTDQSEHVRDLSAMMLGILSATSACEPLMRLAEHDPATVVRVEAVEALSLVGGDATRAFLAALKEKPEPRDVQIRCALALSRIAKGMTGGAALREGYAALDPADFRRARVGMPAPDFVLRDTTGREWTLSSLKGRQWVAVVWIFGEWCPVCAGEFHDLMELQERFRSAGTSVLTVECHDLHRCQAMVGDKPIWWPHLVDPVGRVGLTYGVDPMEFTVHSDWINRPATFIVDPEGILRFAYYGTYWGDRPTIEQTLTMIVERRFVFEHPERRK